MQGAYLNVYSYLYCTCAIMLLGLYASRAASNFASCKNMKPIGPGGSSNVFWNADSQNYELLLGLYYTQGH